MKNRYLLSVIAGLLVLLSACTPIQNSSSETETVSEPAAVQTEPAAEPTAAPEQEAPVETAAAPEEEPSEPTPPPAPQPEAEPAAEDAEYYSGVTAMPKADVEEIARSVRQAYLEQDWPSIAGMIRYPITMYPDVEIQNPDEFLEYMNGKTVHESDAAVMEEETCTDMFFNGQGICMGSGQIWLLDPSYMTEEEPTLQIIAVSGIVEEGE